MSQMDGGEWAWLAVPVTAFLGAAAKAVTWLLRAERERGRSESYKEYSLQTIAAKDTEIAAKDTVISAQDAEITALRAEVATLRASDVRGQER